MAKKRKAPGSRYWDNHMRRSLVDEFTAAEKEYNKKKSKKSKKSKGNRYTKVILDGKEAYMDANSGKIVSPQQAGKGPSNGPYSNDPNYYKALRGARTISQGLTGQYPGDLRADDFSHRPRYTPVILDGKKAYKDEATGRIHLDPNVQAPAPVQNPQRPVAPSPVVPQPAPVQGGGRSRVTSPRSSSRGTINDPNYRNSDAFSGSPNPFSNGPWTGGDGSHDAFTGSPDPFGDGRPVANPDAFSGSPNPFQEGPWNGGDGTNDAFTGSPDPFPEDITRINVGNPRGYVDQPLRDSPRRVRPQQPVYSDDPFSGTPDPFESPKYVSPGVSSGSPYSNAQEEAYYENRRQNPAPYRNGPYHTGYKTMVEGSSKTTSKKGKKGRKRRKSSPRTRFAAAFAYGTSRNGIGSLGNSLGDAIYNRGNQKKKYR